MPEMMKPPPPLVLCCSGHDPTGGAGIQADIEACAALGAHALTLITAHTVQDTEDVQRVTAVAPMLLAQQLQVLRADLPIAAVKLGLLGDAGQLPVLAAALRELRVPVVLDPILRAGGGSNLVGSRLQAALVEELLPLVTIATPNAAEARRLAPGARDLDGCAAVLLAQGCRHVLITGGDEPGVSVINTWYTTGAAQRRYEWPRLAARFHGAGCTLAAALAARLAHGDPLDQALPAAQDYAWQSLQGARALGRGRLIPARL